MKKTYEIVALVILIPLLSWFYFSGISQVPFHPDESTQIYMSQDVDTFVKDFSSFYESNHLVNHYRLVDAPVTRYLIGIGRLIVNESPLKQDWKWDMSWEENIENGALPSDELLYLSRLSVSWVFPLSMILVFINSKEFSGTKSAILSPVLLVCNSLILVHTRRAMAESMTVFSILLFLFLSIKLQRNTWLLAMPAALAINCKQTLFPLAICGLLFQFLPLKKSGVKNQIGYAILYLFLVIGITFLINPILWNHPIETLILSFNERISLSQSQSQMINQLNPEAALDTLLDRINSFFAQIFIIQPAIYDVGNYATQLENASNLYQSNPFHRITSNLAFNLFFLFFSISGFIMACMKYLRKGSAHNSAGQVLLVTTTLQLSILVLIVPLSFQRYYLPAIPFFIIWSVYGISDLIERINHAKSFRR